MKVGDKLSKEKKRKIPDDKTKEGLVYFEIWGILFILFSLILLSQLGPVGRTLNTLMKMVFGDWYWLILIFMFYYGVMMIIYHEFITYSSIKIKGFIFISAGLLIYSHYPIYNAVNLENSNIISESYNLYMSYLNRQQSNATYGGGLLGAFLLWITYAFFGRVGTKIVAIILLISGIAYLFEKTIYDFIDDVYFGVIKLYKSVKKVILGTLDKMKEVSEQNKLQKKELVIDKVPVTSDSQKFENLVFTKSETVEVKPNKYYKPNIKKLKYHENKQILENQKVITIENAKIINDFLKSILLNLEINEVYIGPTISTYIIEVENSIKSKKIKNYEKDLFIRLNVNNIRMYEKYDSKQCLFIEIPNKYRYLVSLREILEDNTDKNLIPIGRNFCGNIYGINFSKMSNILVIGNDIKSKIDLLKTIINVIYYQYSPEEFQLILCDSTKYELNDYEKIHHLYYPFISDFHSMRPMLIKLYSEVDKRLDLVNNNIENFKPILLILNDFVDFYINDNDYLKYLNYILVHGARVNIYVIYATNNLDEQILTNNLRAQFDSIIAFLINSKELSFKYLEDDLTKLLKEGDCVIYSRSDNSCMRVQIANLTEDDNLIWQ